MLGLGHIRGSVGRVGRVGRQGVVRLDLGVGDGLRAFVGDHLPRSGELGTGVPPS